MTPDELLDDQIVDRLLARISEKLGGLSQRSLIELSDTNQVTGRLPNANIVLRAASTLAGNNTGAPADLTDLTPAQVLTLLAITDSVVKPGTMVDYAGAGAVPSGYLLCDGSNVSRTTNAALFTSLSTTWGVGDGSTTFGLPDSRRKVTMGSGGVGTATIGNAVGNSGGEENHALITAELATHLHSVSITSGNQSATHTHGPTGSSNFQGVTPGGDGAALGLVGGGDAFGPFANTGADSVNHTHLVSGNTGNNGSGTAHNTIQPALIVQKMIKT